MSLIDLISSSNPVVSIVGDTVGKLIDRLWPDKIAQAAERAKAEQELLKLAQEDKLDERAKNTQLQLAQIDVNKTEAESESWFTSNWRPFVGWVCGVSLAYAAVLEPIFRFTAQVGFNYMGDFPVLDTGLTLQILGGLLGLGVLRSYDKVKGTVR